MDLADLIEPGQVIFGAHATTKEKLLLDLASRAAASLNLDPKLVFNALQAREQLGSTGLGEGFALPHARIEGLDRFFGMFARLNRPIHFDSVDAKPVDLVFLLLIPAAAQGDHLAALDAIRLATLHRAVVAAAVGYPLLRFSPAPVRTALRVCIPRRREI